MKDTLVYIITFILICVFTFFTYSAFASQPPASFTYQGKIFKSNGVDPVESSSVVFKVQIRSPDGLCLLFEETHQRDMTGTGGVFSLLVGEGSNTNATALPLNSVFDNTAQKTGAAGCVYQPISGDSRRIRFSWDDGVEVVSLPTDQSIRSVPYAMNSIALDGLTKDKFVQISTQTTQAKVDALSTVSTDLINLAAGTSTLYIKATDLPVTSGVLNLSSTGVKVPDAPTSADAAVNQNYADSKIAGKSLDISSLTNGQTLTWNATQNKWVATTISAMGSAGGDLTGTFPSPTVVRIQGTAVASSSPVAGQVYRFNGTSLTPTYLNVSDLKNALGNSQIPSCSTTQTMTYSSVTDTFSCSSIAFASASGDISGTYPNLSLVASGVNAGTYTKTTVDSKGRITAGTLLSASDIPSLAWSKITSGLPTTLAGYGITDAVVNDGSVPSLTAGLDAAKPTAGTAGRIYVASDTLRIYRDNGTAWVVVASSLSVGNGLTSATAGSLAVDTGTTANKIVQLDSSGKLPVIDASNLKGLPPFSNMQVFDSNGTFAVPANITKVYVQVWGAGGGGAGGSSGVIIGLGAGGGSGGGGGAYAAGIISLNGTTSVAINIGTGGAKGGSNSAGSAGGSSTFGGFITSTGGAGGVVGGTTPTLAGSSSAVMSMAGGLGLPPIAAYGGAGGASGNGGTQAPGSFATGNGASDGNSPGCGGGGGYGISMSASGGGKGADGRVVVWY